MKTTKELLAEYKSLAGLDDASSVARKEEIIKELSMRKDADGKEISTTLDTWFSEIEGELKEVKRALLRDQIDKEMSKIIPFSYIATHYFGKSSAWLAQRINGTPVRGKVYTLNEEQKKVFNDALHDIGKKLSVFSLT